MNIILLMENIYNYYNDNQYEMALQEIEKYFQLDGVGISDNLLNLYIECHIRLGLFAGAYKNIELMIRLFPKYYSNFDLAINYCRCFKTDKLEDVLFKYKFTGDEIYDIACSCFFNGNVKKAKELFIRCLWETKNKGQKRQIKKYLKQISLYEDDRGIFEEMKYSYFKYKGYRLEPGHIIYINKLRGEYKENQENDDPKAIRRPYMIWRIIDDTVYAFPVSTKIKDSRSCILHKGKYPARDFDRVVKNEMVCLKERDVLDVVDKVKDDDYERIIRDIYYTVCLNHDVPKKTTEFFMDMMSRELGIDVYDVIVIPDFLHNRRNYYFVLEYDERRHKYKVIEVNYNDDNDFKVIGNEVISISTKTSILSVVKLEDDKKNKLIDGVPINFKKVNMLGKIIENDSRRLEIMIEEKDCYVCIDRTFNFLPSFISIEFIRKDIPLTVIGSVSSEDYQRQLNTLKHYLTQNSNDIHMKRKSFYKHNKRKR